MVYPHEVRYCSQPPGEGCLTPLPTAQYQNTLWITNDKIGLGLGNTYNKVLTIIVVMVHAAGALGVLLGTEEEEEEENDA